MARVPWEVEDLAMAYVDFIEFVDYGGLDEEGFFGGKVVMGEDVRDKDLDQIQVAIAHPRLDAPSEELEPGGPRRHARGRDRARRQRTGKRSSSRPRAPFFTGVRTVRPPPF
jgi:hypothetical protein